MVRAAAYAAFEVLNQSEPAEVRGIAADAHRLYGAYRRRRKRNGTWRHMLHPHRMPLQRIHSMWKRSEDRIGFAGFREFHVENANLRRTLRTA